MRLYRLCEGKKGIEIGSYLAMRDSISLAEALKIEAATCILGDERAEFTDFYQEYLKTGRKKPAKTSFKMPAGPSKAELEAEIEYRESQLTRQKERLMRHRQAVAYAASGQEEPPGRLTLAQAKAIDESIKAQEASIAHARGMLEATAG